MACEATSGAARCAWSAGRVMKKQGKGERTGGAKEKMDEAVATEVAGTEKKGGEEAQRVSARWVETRGRGGGEGEGDGWQWRAVGSGMSNNEEMKSAGNKRKRRIVAAVNGAKGGEVKVARKKTHTEEEEKKRRQTYEDAEVEAEQTVEWTCA